MLEIEAAIRTLRAANASGLGNTTYNMQTGIAWSVLAEHLKTLVQEALDAREDGARRDEELGDLRHQLLLLEEKVMPVVERFARVVDDLAEYLNGMKKKCDQDQEPIRPILADG